MNIIAKGISMEASEVVEKGVKLYAKIEQGLADAADGLWRLHQLHDDAYLAGIINGTEAMEGKAGMLQMMGIVGSAQAGVMADHVFAAEKAKALDIDIATPYAPLPAKTTRGGGDR